jgi:hypothetical protein
MPAKATSPEAALQKLRALEHKGLTKVRAKIERDANREIKRIRSEIRKLERRLQVATRETRSHTNRIDRRLGILNGRIA